MRYHFVCIAIGVGLMLAGPVAAERLSRVVTDVATASDGRGGAQVFFRWTPNLPSGAAVRKATLRFERSGEGVARALTVRVYPVTAAWSGTGPLRYDTELWSHAEVNLAEPGPVVIDVTTVVKEIVEGGFEAYGFVLAADGAEESGLTQADVSRLGGLSSGTIDVTWRRVPAAPRR